ncbi:proton pump-interactor BIP103-like [Hibiscus syriacus]|uniref:proton pump-interactor BIP103-like n=1 Tax=Hibiscus syriacus TaxID=106335 RepID=UPI001923E954|nr:proton pump-interactor BIP103-like [Hibiscus syriacus]
MIKEMARRQHRVNDLGLTNSPVEAFIMNFCWGKIEKPGYTGMLEKLQQIEDGKKKALAHSAEKANIFNPFSVKSAIEEQIKIVKKISIELREEEQEVKSKIKRLEKQLKPMKDKASVYRARRPETAKRKEAPQRRILKLRQTSVKMNGMYDEYVSLLSHARELARNKDIAALRKLSQHQVEEFTREWNNPYFKTFRINYEFSISDSLRNRQLSHQGRIRLRNDSKETLR